MRTFTIDGQNVLLFRERGAGDGGTVLNYMVEETDGTFSNYRHWYSDPALAEQEFSASTDEDVRARIIRARKIAAGEPVLANEQPVTAIMRREAAEVVKSSTRG